MKERLIEIGMYLVFGLLIYALFLLITERPFLPDVTTYEESQVEIRKSMGK